jgi:hypothetical protein
VLGVQPVLARQEILLGLADLHEVGPLPAEKPDPEVQPRRELREAVHPDENIHEGHVLALVHQRGPLLQALLGRLETLPGLVEIVLSPGDLTVQLVHLVQRVVVRGLRRARLDPDLHQTVLGSGNVGLLGPDAVGLSPRREARHEHERNSETKKYEQTRPSRHGPRLLSVSYMNFSGDLLEENPPS